MKNKWKITSFRVFVNLPTWQPSVCPVSIEAVVQVSHWCHLSTCAAEVDRSSQETASAPVVMAAAAAQRRQTRVSTVRRIWGASVTSSRCALRTLALAQPWGQSVTRTLAGLCTK